MAVRTDREDPTEIWSSKEMLLPNLVIPYTDAEPGDIACNESTPPMHQKEFPTLLTPLPSSTPNSPFHTY